MTNTQSHAKRELDILIKSTPDAIIRDFVPELLALCEAFGNSGQSGGSAPFTAGALSNAVKKLCLQQPICPITGIDDEWGTVADGLNQNNRCSALFRNDDGKAYYLDAIVWKGEREHDTFTGTVSGIRSRQFIKGYPFTPKTFYVDCIRVPYDKSIHDVKDSVSCGDGDYCYFIKDEKQLDEVFEYYDKSLSKFEGKVESN